MKKKFVFLAILFANSYAIFAQGLGIGVKGGISQTNFWDDPNTEYTEVKRFTLGLIFTQEYTHRISFQPELLYATKSAELVDATLFDNIDLFQFNIAYLEIPVLSVIHLAPERTVDPVIYAGPVPAARISSKVKYGKVGEGFLVEETDESVKAFDLGGSVGGALNISIGNQKLSFDARYTLGLLNIVGNNDDPKRNKSLSFTVGVVF